MSTLSPAFTQGAVVVRREVLHGRLWLETPVTVVADDGDVLGVLLEPGSPFVFHDHPFGVHPWAGHAGWSGPTVLMLHRAGDAYSVWKFFTDGVFTHWYVNFETPIVRHDGAFDTDDHALDLIVHPDGRPEWKDVEHLHEMITSGRMTPDQVVHVLRDAAGVSALLREGRRWWASYDDWTPAAFVRPVPPVSPASPGATWGAAPVTTAVPATVRSEPASAADLPRLLATPEGRRDLGHEIACLVREPDFAAAEALLAGHLDAFPGPISAACLAVGAGDVAVEGWDELNADLTRLVAGGHAVSAVGLDLSNYRDASGDTPDQEPLVEVAAYTDVVFPFSSAGREDILGPSATYAAPWTGSRLGDEEAVLVVRGLRTVNGALLLRESEHPWRPGGAGDLPGESVAEFLGWWWLHLRFHQAVAAHLAAEGLALAVPVVVGSHDVGPWLVSAYLVDRVADHASSTARILADRATGAGAAFDAVTAHTVAELRELRANLKGWGLRNRDKRKTFEEYADARLALTCQAAGLPAPGRPLSSLRDSEFEQLVAAYAASRRRAS